MLTYFLILKINGNSFMQSPCCLCASASPQFTVEWLNKSLWIMAPEPISMEYFIKPSHQSACLCVPP
jgi:hypothetical protein